MIYTDEIAGGKSRHILGYLDGKYWVEYRNPEGEMLFRLWESPLPRIPNHVADCSVYFYESQQAAKAGSNAGGSGFLVHYPSEIEGYGHLYAVTNKHVIDAGFCVLRLNRKSGDTDTQITQPEDWINPKSGNDDIAVCPIDIGENFKWWSVTTNIFVNPSIIETFKIGYGDEVVLVGRLITHAGKQKNSPVVRFGNISLMADPTEPIRYNKGEQEGFLVECRSLSGFSGSPVFVTTNQTYHEQDAQRVVRHKQAAMGYDPEKSEVKFTAVVLSGTQGPWLLGIDFGHIPLWNPVFKKDRKTNRRAITEYEVEANTGIAGVIPAWKILDLLNAEKLMKQRKHEDKILAKRLDAENSIVLDVAKPSSVFTQEDFESALRKVSRKLTPEERKKLNESD